MTPEQRADKAIRDSYGTGDGGGRELSIYDLEENVALAIREAVEEAKAQVRAEERDACAKIADEYWTDIGEYGAGMEGAKHGIASAIRARSKGE